MSNAIGLTVKDVALMLGVSRSTIYRLMREGILRSAKIGGARRFRCEWIEAAMDAAADGGPAVDSDVLAEVLR